MLKKSSLTQEIDKEILELLTAKFQHNKPKNIDDVNFEKLLKKNRSNFYLQRFSYGAFILLFIAVL